MLATAPSFYESHMLTDSGEELAHPYLTGFSIPPSPYHLKQFNPQDMDVIVDWDDIANLYKESPPFPYDLKSFDKFNFPSYCYTDYTAPSTISEDPQFFDRLDELLIPESEISTQSKKRSRGDVDDLFVVNKKQCVINEEPVPFTPPKDIVPLFFSVENPGQFNGYVFKSDVSPERRAIVKKEIGYSPLVVDEFNLNGSPCDAFIKNGEELVQLKLSMKTQGIYTYASLNRELPNDVYNPLNKSLAKPSIPQFTRFSGSTVVTKDVIAGREGTRKTHRPTQKQSMDYWTACNIARAAGVEVTGSYHHTHVIRFLFTPEGQEPNDPQNLIIATAGANFQHLQLEDTAKALVTKHGAVVISFDIPLDQEVFDPELHLFGFVNYYIHEAKPELLAKYQAGEITADEAKGALLQSFKIDCLNPNFPHSTDQKYIQAYAYASKLRAHGFVSADDYKKLPKLELP